MDVTGILSDKNFTQGVQVCSVNCGFVADLAGRVQYRWY